MSRVSPHFALPLPAFATLAVAGTARADEHVLILLNTTGSMSLRSTGGRTRLGVAQQRVIDFRVNQVEIWFGTHHRRILKHGDFATAAAMVDRVEAFIRHWNRVEAHPFRWTFRGRFQDHDSRQAA